MVHGIDAVKYGLTPEQWQSAKAEMREVLIGVAKLQATITYGDLAAQLRTISPHPGSYVFQALLRDLCREELAAGRGMLCALVVAKATGIPGQGFFKALIGLGRDCSEIETCWQEECQRVYAVWNDAD